MSQPTQPPFTLNMTPGSRIRMNKYNIGPEGIQINCGTPTNPPGRFHSKRVDDKNIIMTLWPGSQPMISGAGLAGQKKIDLVCKAKPM